MNIRYGLLCASILAGIATMDAPASAEPARPAVAHPHWTHPARPFRPGIRPGFRPGHPGFRPGYRYGRPYFHRFGFRGPIVRLSIADRAIWTRGHWRHAWFHGRFGWWFVAGGGWYFYSQPVYPYPDSISDTYYADESGGYADDQGYGGGDSGQNWYYCRSPQGYYPYIKSCAGGWQTVPATPQDQSDSDGDSYGPPDQDGGYDNGPPPDSGGYDNGPPPDDSGDYEDDDNYGPPR